MKDEVERPKTNGKLVVSRSSWDPEMDLSYLGPLHFELIGQPNQMNPTTSFHGARPAEFVVFV